MINPLLPSHVSVPIAAILSLQSARRLRGLIDSEQVAVERRLPTQPRVSIREVERLRGEPITPELYCAALNERRARISR